MSELNSLAGARVLVTGGAGTIGSTIVDQLLGLDVAEVRVLDNLVRGRRANLRDVLDDPRLALVEGDIRDRDLVNDLTSGTDLVFHEAAIRITQCAEEPRLALEVLVDGTFNVIEAAAAHKVGKLVAASSASVYGLAEEFPTKENHHPYDNDTFYGAAKSFNEGMLRSFRAMTGLDYVALRYFNVYGPRMDIHGLYTEVLIRWMERITAGLPPLIFGDGAQTMDFVYTVDIARANLLAAVAPVNEGVYNIASGVETSLSSWPRGCSRRWAPISASSTVPSARSTGSPDGWPAPRLPIATLASWQRSGWSTDCASSSTGGRASGPATRSRPLWGFLHEPDQRDAALPRAGGDRRGRRGDQLRLGRPGAAGRGVRVRLCRSHAGGVRRRNVVLHHGPAPGNDRRRRRGR